MKILQKRRRIERKTNYHKRKKLLEHSKARIVLRKTNRYMIIQYVESKEAQDSITFSVISKELLKHGWPKEKEGSLKSLGASYLAGVLFAKKVKKVGKIALDTGLIRSTKGSKIYAAIKGMIDSGLEINCDKEMFPEPGRIVSENLKPFFEKVKANIMGGKQS